MSWLNACAKTLLHLATHISMRQRLTTLVMTVTLLVLMATTNFINKMAISLIEHSPQEQMVAANNTLKAAVTVWLENHHSALSYLASLPDITSMKPEQQKPLLKRMAAAYPHMYLVSVVDLNGLNSARNDNEIFTDYQSRAWFRQVCQGAQIVFDSIIGKTSGKPALVVSMPVKDNEGHQLSLQVQSTRVGQTGFAYLVDPDNRVVAHPDSGFSLELRNFSKYPPVNRARSGQTGEMRFNDQHGTTWVAYSSALGNGWLGWCKLKNSNFPLNRIHFNAWPRDRFSLRCWFDADDLVGRAPWPESD